jgi:2-polyprenyl-6-methoxyphenol hydroxylase-like FAD-dependent oxidoreductase
MAAENTKRVLVCGAGIGGPTLAYWLKLYGYQPTLIEIAPSLREGGYMIDFWGVGYDVAERMGLIPRLRSVGYQIDELLLRDAKGQRITGVDTHTLRKTLGGRFFSILRGDLASEIYRTVDGKIEAIFGDTITAIAQDSDQVHVTFKHAAPRNFDLVIGADGLHSAVRRIGFNDDGAESFLGYYAASFAIDGYPHRDVGAYVTYTAPRRQVARYALRDNRSAFFLIFARDTELAIEHHDVDAQKRVLHEVFGDGQWECPEILAALDGTDELYFDAVSQIHIPAWSQGRVALLGDAAFCPSLLAGQGSAFAMLGAYVLASEIKRADGDYKLALRCYEQRLRPFIENKQRAALRIGSWFAPKTSIGLFARNQITRMMSLPVIGDWIIKRTVADRYVLPDYGT